MQRTPSLARESMCGVSTLFPFPPDESLLRAHLVAVATEGAQVMLVGLNDNGVRSVGPEHKQGKQKIQKKGTHGSYR